MRAARWLQMGNSGARNDTGSERCTHMAEEKHVKIRQAVDFHGLPLMIPTTLKLKWDGLTLHRILTETYLGGIHNGNC